MKVAPGVLCRVVGGVLHPSPNLGKIVEVIAYQGEHSLHGPIWSCKFANSEGISEYGVMGSIMDFAEDWLKPINGEKQKGTKINAFSI